MLSRAKILLLAAAALSLIACSSSRQPSPGFYSFGSVNYPHVAKYPASYQRKLWTVRHWKDAAAHVAMRLQRDLCQCQGNTMPAGWRLYVQPPEQPSEFSKAFHELLVTQLVNRGFRITTSPYTQALPLSYQVDLVPHRWKGERRKGPNNEILVTASVVAGDRYLSRISDAYYVADYDMSHFYAQAPVRTIGVTNQ